MIYLKETVLSKSGKTVPLFKSGKPSHSKYSPEKEEVLLDKDFSGCVVCLGIAGGFHIKNLLLNPKITLLIALEIDKESLDFCKSLSEVHSLLKDKRVVFSTLEELNSTLCNFYLPSLHGPISFLFLRSWENEMPKIKEEVEKEMSSSLKKISSDFSVQAHFGLLWHRNILLNLKLFSSSPLSFSWNETIKPILQKGSLSKTAIIVAAGPSLDLSIKEIKKEDFFIVATDTSFPTLLENGVTPDVVVSIDCQHVSCEHFFCCEKDMKTLFVFDIASNPEAIRLVISKGNRVQFIKNSHPLSFLLGDNIGIKKIEEESGTVAIAAGDWAKKAGFKKIKFFAADFSYSSGKPYAKGTYLEKQFLMKSMRTKTEETQYCSLMYRTPLQTISQKERIYSTEILQRYKSSLLEWKEKNFFIEKEGYFITEKTINPLESQVEIFSYEDFMTSFLDGINSLLLKKEENLSLLKNEVTLSLLPLLSSLKSQSFFDGVKLAYNRTLRYN